MKIYFPCRLVVLILLSVISITAPAIALEDDSTKVTAKCFLPDTLFMNDLSQFDFEGNFVLLSDTFFDRISAEQVTVDGTTYLLYTKVSEHSKSPRPRYLAGKTVKFEKGFYGRRWSFHPMSKDCKALAYLLKKISARGQPTKLHDPKGDFYANDEYDYNWMNRY